MKNINYDFYLDLSDKELEKIICHIKNIQSLRKKELEKIFLTFDWNQVEPILPKVNKDQLIGFVSLLEQRMQNSDITPLIFDFYLQFYKKFSHTNLYFKNIHHDFMWKHATIEYLETIRKEEPNLFEELKSYSICPKDKAFISYCIEHRFIDLNLKIQANNLDSLFISYLIDIKHPWLKHFSLEKNLHNLDYKTLSDLRNYSQLEQIDLKKLSENPDFDYKDYFRNLIYKNPEILEHFKIDSFFIENIMIRIESFYKKESFLPFFQKFFDLIQTLGLEENFQKSMNDYVRNKNAKKIVQSFILNHSLSQSLTEKETKPSLKI
jgi:hypothetical protein